MSWMDVAAVDPFTVAAAGPCPFRTQDLVELLDLVQGLARAATGTELLLCPHPEPGRPAAR